MSYLSQKEITRLEFLKIFGVSSVSLLLPGLLPIDTFAQTQSGDSIKVANIAIRTLIKPDVIDLRSDGMFGSIVVLPPGYNVANVDVSSVRCEGAPALKRRLHYNNRTLMLLYNTGDLRDNLPGGFAVELTVSGQLRNGSLFKGSDTVAVTGSSKGVIYHTSTRKRKSCNACKSHAVSKIFASRKAAAANRAHPGCNCVIVKEEINWRYYSSAFGPTSKGGKDVYDKRWGWSP
jgi:hypothetical protein